jgi:glutamate N-acetyltransferase/amino-acid N-acetyltransferase
MTRADDLKKVSKKKLRKTVAKLLKKLGTASEPAVAPQAAKAAKPVSPLAPAGLPVLPEIAGVRFAAAEAGVKYKGRRDVMLVHLASGTVIAGAFTRSSTRSAPVLDCQSKIGLPSDGAAAILVNAGNSNAFTGSAGVEAVQKIAGAVAGRLGIPETRVYTASTGVIGQPLPWDRIVAKIDDLASSLTPGRMDEAASAIMTTDTFPKAATRSVTLPGGEVRIAGIAKGSGMIAPDMATMLVYIFTDAKVSQPHLQKMVSGLVGTTFNAITVDSDTSTSDTLMVCATGQSDADAITDLRSRPARAFQAALGEVMLDLAHQVVKDGEGATKFVTVRVTGARTDADARRVAMAIANSPLVKTAIAGEDPNWGRVVMAVGKSGAEADRDRLTISFGDIVVAENGWVSPGYTEEAGAAHMRQAEITIHTDLGLGSGAFTAWTCDLTNRYIEINADYRS